MDTQTWEQAFSDRGNPPVTMETKVVLFLYLMTQEADFGRNIATNFNNAIGSGKWTDRRGLGDLKHENKVVSALKQMEKSGLIFKSTELKNKVPSCSYLNKSTVREIKENYNAHYYSVNPLVFTFNQKETNFPINSDIYDGVRFVQEYYKDAIETIELINKLQKFDYLTIFTTMIWIYRDAVKRLSGSSTDEGDAVGPSFFNDGTQLEKILKDNCSMWSKDLQEQIEFEKVPPTDYLEKFERVLSDELMRCVYSERVIT